MNGTANSNNTNNNKVSALPKYQSKHKYYPLQVSLRPCGTDIITFTLQEEIWIQSAEITCLMKYSLEREAGFKRRETQPRTPPWTRTLPTDRAGCSPATQSQIPLLSGYLFSVHNWKQCNLNSTALNELSGYQ